MVNEAITLVFVYVFPYVFLSLTALFWPTQYVPGASTWFHVWCEQVQRKGVYHDDSIVLRPLHLCPL